MFKWLKVARVVNLKMIFTDGTFFMGGLNLSIHHVFLFCNCTRNEIREMGKKWGREKFLYFMQLFMHYIFYGENFVG